MPNDTLKIQICDCLAAFIRQRPGLDPRNYISHGLDDAGRSAYRSEQRSIARDKRDAETLLQAVRWRESITAEHLIEASRRAFSGRLTIKVTALFNGPVTVGPGALERMREAETGEYRVSIDYCTGQYWPTEYRKAVAAVCAYALWEWQRASMPKGTLMHNSETGETLERYGDNLSAGDWLRRQFRREFGSKMQKRWFD